MTAFILFWDQPATHPPTPEQSRRKDEPSHNLASCSMIHMTTDDAYSTLSLFPAHTKIYIYTQRYMTKRVPADIRPTLGSRHASLSETAALISRSNTGLSLTVRGLTDPCVYSHNHHFTMHQLLMNPVLHVWTDCVLNTSTDSQLACHFSVPDILIPLCVYISN